MSLIKITTTFLLLLNFINVSSGQKPEFKNGEFIIYSVKEKKLVEPSVIIEDMANYDVLFYGEEHNDIITHKLQNLLFQMMFEKYGGKTIISMEMFERDVQYIMDEYLTGKIKESYFRKDSRSWGNYSDYRPMVEFAKEKGLYVLAANAPFRYVNMASRNGQEALLELSDQAKKAIAPLPYNVASGDYAEKLLNLGKDEKKDKKAKKDVPKPDSTSTDTVKKPKYSIINGHSLWDATMAWSVSQYKKQNPDAKIMHLNGRFHTAEHFGIIQRMKEYDDKITSLVITSEAVTTKFDKINFEEYEKLGDYIVFTSFKEKKKKKK